MSYTRDRDDTPSSIKFNRRRYFFIIHLHFIEQRANQLVISESLGQDSLEQCDLVMREDCIRNFGVFTYLESSGYLCGKLGVLDKNCEFPLADT